MAAVWNLQAVLEAAGLPTEWRYTAGGCYSLIVPFKGVEILINDTEAPFTAADYESDGGVWGFYVCAYKLEPDGSYTDDDSDGWIYTTIEDDGWSANYAEAHGVKAIDLEQELDMVFAAILNAVDAGQVGGVPLELA